MSKDGAVLMRGVPVSTAHAHTHPVAHVLLRAARVHAEARQIDPRRAKLLHKPELLRAR
jgi:hypothetical protein